MEDFEVRNADVVVAAVLLDVEGVPGHELRIPPAKALELDGGGGEAEDGAERSPGGRHRHAQPRLQHAQLVPDVWL